MWRNTISGTVGEHLRKLKKKKCFRCNSYDNKANFMTLPSRCAEVPSSERARLSKACHYLARGRRMPPWTVVGLEASDLKNPVGVLAFVCRLFKCKNFGLNSEDFDCK
jgi:hypothetical protein